MPEGIKTTMERMRQVLPTMDDVSLALIAGYADGYAARSEREAEKDGRICDKDTGSASA